jgi:hypothetical protein
LAHEIFTSNAVLTSNLDSQQFISDQMALLGSR